MTFLGDLRSGKTQFSTAHDKHLILAHTQGDSFEPPFQEHTYLTKLDAYGNKLVKKSISPLNMEVNEIYNFVKLILGISMLVFNPFPEVTLVRSAVI